MSSNEPIILTKITPTYWRATFNNGTLNLFSPESYIALKNLIAELESDTTVRVIVFDSSSPDFFIAHADILRVAEEPQGQGTGFVATWASLAARITRLPVVTIASVRGYARGFGADFANTCDLRFASRERAVFCQPEVGAGIIPGGGAFEFLPRKVGRARALEILLSSDDYDATTAELYGWINRAIPDAEFEEYVDKFARRIAGFDAKLLVETKRVVDARWGMPSQVNLAAGMALFSESTKWPGAARMKALFDKGLQHDEETERNLGAVLGTVTEQDLSKYTE